MTGVKNSEKLIGQTEEKNKKEERGSIGPVLFFGFIGSILGKAMVPKMEIGRINLNYSEKEQIGIYFGFFVGAIVGYKISKTGKERKDEDSERSL
ncbi:MAG: hypothetical protein DWQ05_06455 [Calditrichaeota bacterium]|nr:MAG: hypothetical protein DWQ05_06455 [Calditrichota bacterium]